MAKTRPENDRRGAEVLADCPPMGATTANSKSDQTAGSAGRVAAAVPRMRDATGGTAGGADNAPSGTAGALRGRLRSPGRPRLWFEVVLIALSYWIYSLIRNAVPEQTAAAMRHAKQVWQLQQSLGIAVEKSVNTAVDSVTWLIVGMNYYYATLHFVVTISVLVWLYRRHPGRYGPIRLVLFATTGLALIGYYLYPLAPPRLMVGGGFIDTVVVHHTWGSMASGDLANVSNQYAAMPSMHIGWSMWAGITLAVLARRVWVKVLGVVYPMVTLLVIVSTGNHFLLDAAGGATCLGLGFLVAFAVHGRWAYAFPQLPEAAGPLPAMPSRARPA